MKWFFALNQSSSLFECYCEMAKAAVISACKNTDLEPVLLFDGNSQEFIQWMQNYRVTVIQMESSLTEVLAKIAPDRLDIGKGAFLRVDIPWVMDRMSWTDPYEAQIDYLNHLTLQQSIYRQYCDDNEICDWRAVKGALTLWTMYHGDDFETYLAFLGLYSKALECLERAYSINPNDEDVNLGLQVVRQKIFEQK